MSAITFTLQNGTTVVLGLNIFINYIGFDIISFHKGYATSGIQTNELISDSVQPETYVGVMFGFFGYWFGQNIDWCVFKCDCCRIDCHYCLVTGPVKPIKKQH